MVKYLSPLVGIQCSLVMDDSIEDLYKRLTLTDLEQEPILLDAQDKGTQVWKFENNLMVRLLAEKPYNKEAFWFTMKRAWKLVHPVKFRDLGGQVSLVEFSANHDKVNTISEGPWMFNKHLVVFQEVDESLQVK